MKYIAFYDLPEYKDENRSAYPSAVAVIKYMTEVFETIEPVTVLSPARSLNKAGCYRGRKHKIDNNVSLILPFSIGVNNSLGRFLVVAYTQLWLFFRLLFSVQANECIVAYHSISTMRILKLIKKLKHVRLIEEVREVYSDINQMSSRMKKAEYEYFANADGYIFATELLNKKINTQGKPYVVAPATYKMESIITDKYVDGDVHLIYAGTLRITKGGAINAVQAAQYLPKNYHLHIVGYGGEEAITVLKDEIKHVTDINPLVKITYDGLLFGEDFTRYLQKCHIGLSTQNPEGAYNDSSFPSKIMTYLANGLEVVSIRIPAVETSPVGPYIHYYNGNDSKKLADTICSIELNKCIDKSELMNKLHTELIRDTEKLLKNSVN